MTSTELEQNQRSYDMIYGERRTFLRYPADWIIRFHNIYMRKNIPSGRVLDYGCGSGNNLKFFADAGYDVYGTEITDTALPLVRENGVDPSRVAILRPEETKLPYADGHFDFVLSNQVLYYLAEPSRIRTMCDEFKRILRPGGAVFFTMMGMKNYYISEGYAKPRGGGRL